MPRRRDRAHRDQGRHDTRGQHLDPRRSSEGDSGRLRGEPHCARRPAHRPLPRPHARSADSMADFGARARATRRRRTRDARRSRERQPTPARRGARARADLGGAGRTQRLRRPRPPRRGRRALRRDRGRGDRPLTARWTSPRGRARSPAAARRRRERTRGNPGRGRARLAARPLSRDRPDPRSPAAGDGALGRPGRDARPRARRTSRSHRCVRSTAPEAHPPALADGGRDPRDGRPGSGEEPHRGGVRRTRLPPSQPRRARRILARARRCARRCAGSRSIAGRPRQHVSHPRQSELRDRDGEPTRGRSTLHLARHATRAGAGQPRRAPARAVRRASGTREAARACTA